MQQPTNDRGTTLSCNSPQTTGALINAINSHNSPRLAASRAGPAVPSWTQVSTVHMVYKAKQGCVELAGAAHRSRLACNATLALRAACLRRLWRSGAVAQSGQDTCPKSRPAQSQHGVSAIQHSNTLCRV